MGSRRLFVTLSLALCWRLASCAERSPQGPALSEPVNYSLVLAPGLLAEGEVEAGEVEVYSLDLAAGESLRIEADQRWIDLELLLRSPGGRQLHHFDSPFGSDGPELLCFVAKKSGRYYLNVAPFGRRKGKYTVRWSPSRGTRDQDELCELGQQQFMAAENLRKQRVPLPELLGAYSIARETFATAEEDFLEGLALREMGVTATQVGQSIEARSSFMAALDRFLEIGESALAVQMLNFLGLIELDRGALEAAEESFREASARAAASGDETGRATAQNNLGRVAEERGDTYRALRLFETAVELYRLRGRAYEESQALRNLGYAHLLLGHSRRARQILDHALQRAQESGNHEAEAGIRVNLGLCLLVLEEMSSAIDQLKKGKYLHEKAGRTKALAGTLDRLGTAYRRAGEDEAALSAYREALRLATELKNPRSLAPAHANLGCLLADLGNRREARIHLQEAVSTFEKLDTPDGHALALVCRARLERAEGRFERAQVDLETALKMFDRIREGARRWGVRFPSFAPWVDTQEIYVDLLVEVSRWNEDPALLGRAFEVSDQGRARNFVEEVLEGDLGFREAATPETQSKEERLLQELVTASSEAELERLRLELAMVRAQTRTSHSRFEQFLRPPPTRTRDIQLLLDAETALLSFELAGERSFVFLLTHDGLEVFDLKPKGEIERQVERTYFALQESHKTGGGGQAKLVADRLAQGLLAAALEGFDGSRLVLVGDGWIHYLPWSALPRPGTDRYLIEDFELVSLPAAGLLESLRRRGARRAASTPSVAAVGDPVFSYEDQRITVSKGSCPPGPLLPDLPRLPASRREAEAAVSYSAPGQGLLALDFDARKELVSEGALQPFQVLHLATHAVANEQVPELSALYFSATGPDGCPREGGLYLEELFSLDLAADLVVLSACRSALGRRVRGEGIQGLTRGFFAAGAARLVVSLWAVDDEATAELMKLFYAAHLGEGLPASRALQRAQVGLQAHPRWAAPYYWAGFQVQGDWQGQQSSSDRD